MIKPPGTPGIAIYFSSKTTKDAYWKVLGPGTARGASAPAAPAAPAALAEGPPLSRRFSHGSRLHLGS